MTSIHLMEIKGEEEMGEKLRNDGRVEGRIRNQENKKEKKKNRPKSSFRWSLLNLIWRIPPGIIKLQKGKKTKKNMLSARYIYKGRFPHNEFYHRRSR